MHYSNNESMSIGNHQICSPFLLPNKCVGVCLYLVSCVTNYSTQE